MPSSILNYSIVPYGIINDFMILEESISYSWMSFMREDKGTWSWSANLDSNSKKVPSFFIWESMIYPFSSCMEYVIISGSFMEYIEGFFILREIFDCDGNISFSFHFKSITSWILNSFCMNWITYLPFQQTLIGKVFL